MHLRVINEHGSTMARYEGFQEYTGKSEWLAIVSFDGERDLYDCDGPLARKEIIRMYMDDFGREPESILILNKNNGV